MWEYTDTVKELFLRPKNSGELPDANAIGEIGSLSCGDALKLFLKINDNNIIEDASFLTFGCASAIASSSVLTEMLKGKTVEEASKITNKDIAAQLGGLPREKIHCSVMGEEALEAALRNWKGEAKAAHCHDEHIVCRCFGVSEELIRNKVKENALSSVDDVTNYTKAGGGCGDCIVDIQAIIDEANGIAQSQPIVPKTKLTNIQRMQKVMDVIEQEIQPVLQGDGGRIELIDINGPTVSVALRGNCTGCQSRQVTLSELVGKILREHVDSEIIVEEVSI